MRINALIAAFVLWASPALAQESMAKAELLVDAPTAQSGEIVWVGVKFTIPKDWHIYWQNPGDSGIATTLEWTLPEGVTAGAIQWPAPSRIIMGDLVNYGYADAVTLPVPLTLNADMKGPITVKADWLICHDICIPESATLTATLPHTDDHARMELQAARNAVPMPFPGSANFAANENDVALLLTPSMEMDPPVRAEFLPIEDGIIENNSNPLLSHKGRNFSVGLSRGSADLPSEWHGVLWLEWKNKAPVAYAITAKPSTAPLVSVSEAPVLPLFVILVLAFAGGFLLNIMPCVLPVLSLKALALVKKANLSPRAVRTQGFAYTLGVVISFLLIAGVMLGLKFSGEAVGWGFQLQSPITVGLLCALMIAVSLNLLGFLHLPVLFGHIMVDHEGTRGTFLTGVLAVAVATPCTAPFMATAVGATLALPAAISLLIFAVMGLGMASPFLLISLWPAAQRLLPKPGAWMHRFRHILAIPMLLTALWLFYVLMQLLYPTPMDQAKGYRYIEPVPYSAETLSALRAQNVPVFVDATAAWCLTCKVNERVALKPTDTQKFFQKHNITLMVADWTARDDEIAAYLATFGRNGVPLYVYYPPGSAPVILPQILTPAIVTDTLRASMTKR